MLCMVMAAMFMASRQRAWQERHMNALSLNLDALLVGKSAMLAPGVPSAIDKQPRAGAVRIGWLGLEGDEQADTRHHGGPDKALHLVPREHYPWWAGTLAGHRLLDRPGAFGENLATCGALEAQLCIGDRFTLGTALVEVSQGRQPCFKLNHRFGRPDMLALAVESGRCGLYLRVVRQGEARAGDVMTLVERVLPEWSVARVFALLIQGGHKADPAGVAALAALPRLAPNWRARAAALAR